MAKLTEEEKKQKYYQKLQESRLKNAIKLKERQKLKYEEQKELGVVNEISDKRLKVFEQDKEVYKKVWDSHPDHKCEECGEFLGDIFEDETGKVINTFRYSHILAKGSHPKLRHIPLNFKLYCLKCHSKWEFEGEEERKKMKTYNPNLIKKLLKIEQEL